jgi:hypothetical protein
MPIGAVLLSSSRSTTSRDRRRQRYRAVKRFGPRLPDFLNCEGGIAIAAGRCRHPARPRTALTRPAFAIENNRIDGRQDLNV